MHIIFMIGAKLQVCTLQTSYFYDQHASWAGMAPWQITIIWGLPVLAMEYIHAHNSTTPPGSRSISAIVN